MNTILIVDDEKSILEIASAILKKGGYRTVCAESADEAENAIKRERIDLAVIDVVLPGRGGLDLLMKLRDRHPKLPIIMMSGKINTGSEPFSKLAGQFGAKCLLSKPFTAEGLKSAVSSVLAQACV